MKNGLKIYEIPQRFDYDTEKLMATTEPIAVIKPFDDSFNKVININGNLYSAGISIGKASALFVRKIEMDMDEEETSYEANIKCPVCGYENYDSWEISDDSDDKYECGNCYSILSWERNVEVSYSATVKEVSEPFVAELLN